MEKWQLRLAVEREETFKKARKLQGDLIESLKQRGILLRLQIRNQKFKRGMDILKWNKRKLC